MSQTKWNYVEGVVVVVVVGVKVKASIVICSGVLGFMVGYFIQNKIKQNIHTYSIRTVWKENLINVI